MKMDFSRIPYPPEAPQRNKKRKWSVGGGGGGGGGGDFLNTLPFPPFDGTFLISCALCVSIQASPIPEEG